ncbi:MAG: CPBP family intramembrane glutamic endopeptidase [Bacteroidota bacterium]
MNERNQYDIAFRFQSPGLSILLGFGLLCICFLFSSFAAGTIFQTFAPDKTIEELVHTPGGRNLYRMLQAFANLATWGLAATFWAIYTGGFRKQLGLQHRTWTGYFPLAALTIIVALPFVEWLLIDSESFKLPEALKGVEEWARSQENSSSGTLVSLLGDTSFSGVFGNIIVIAVIPAISEELFFRGFLLGTLNRMMNAHVAVWLSAFIFSLVHLQFFGFFSRLLMGALLGYFYLWSGNLLASMVAHFAHNLLNILLAVLAIKGILGPGVLQDDFGFGMPVTLCSVLITCVLLYIYRRQALKLNTILRYE